MYLPTVGISFASFGAEELLVRWQETDDFDQFDLERRLCQCID